MKSVVDPVAHVADPGFHRKGAPTREFWAENLLFSKIFAEYYMKIKEIGPRRSLVPPLDPPMWIYIDKFWTRPGPIS